MSEGYEYTPTMTETTTNSSLGFTESSEIDNDRQVIKINAVVEGRPVGVVKINETKPDERGLRIYRSRIEVDESQRGQGYGSQLRSELFNKLQSIADQTGQSVIHQEAFTDMGQRLQKAYMSVGYNERADVSEVIEKVYKPQPKPVAV